MARFGTVGMNRPKVCLRPGCNKRAYTKHAFCSTTCSSAYLVSARANRVADVLGSDSDLVNKFILDAKALNDAVTKVEITFRELRGAAREVISQGEWAQLIRVELPTDN